MNGYVLVGRANWRFGRNFANVADEMFKENKLT